MFLLVKVAFGLRNAATFSGSVCETVCVRSVFIKMLSNALMPSHAALWKVIQWLTYVGNCTPGGTEKFWFY